MKEYEQFGAEWYAEMMKWSKPRLIEFMREMLMNQETVSDAYLRGYNEATSEAQQEIAKNYHPNK